MFKWRLRPASPVPPSVPSPALPGNSLLDAQICILGNDSAIRVVDAGSHHGHTAKEYLDAFPYCRVIGLEPEIENYAKAEARLSSYENRVELIRAGLSDTVGIADLRLTSHDGAHSLLEVGDMRYYDEVVDVLPPIPIETLTLDHLCSARGIDVLDILKMDIQGGELLALKGAQAMLSRGGIRLIALEVLFQPLYRNQPTFWNLAEYLQGYGYGLQGIYDFKHLPGKHAVLRWADAIFVSPQMQVLP